MYKRFTYGYQHWSLGLVLSDFNGRWVYVVMSTNFPFVGWRIELLLETVRDEIFPACDRLI